MGRRTLRTVKGYLIGAASFLGYCKEIGAAVAMCEFDTIYQIYTTILVHFYLNFCPGPLWRFSSTEISRIWLR